MRPIQDDRPAQETPPTTCSLIFRTLSRAAWPFFAALWSMLGAVVPRQLAFPRAQATPSPCIGAPSVRRAACGGPRPGHDDLAAQTVVGRAAAGFARAPGCSAGTRGYARRTVPVSVVLIRATGLGRLDGLLASCCWLPVGRVPEHRILRGAWTERHRGATMRGPIPRPRCWSRPRVLGVAPAHSQDAG